MRAGSVRRALCWGDVSEAWSQLSAAQPASSHFQLQEWARASWLADGERGAVARWLCAEDDDGPLAVLHCELHPIGGTRARLHKLSNGSANCLVAARCDARALWHEVLRWFARAGEPIAYASFNRLREGSGFHALAVASRARVDEEWRHGGYSVVVTEVSGDKWFATASKNLRASLRKARNRLDHEGKARIAVALTPDEVWSGFEQYVLLEARGWKGTAGALVNRPWEHALIREFLLAAAEKCQASVRTLWVEDQVAAAMLEAIVGSAHVVLKTSYDEAFAHLSPGNLLMADLVRACCDDPLVSHIDLVTDTPWHDRWHPTKHPTFHAQRFNLRRPGGLVVAAAAIPRTAAQHRPSRRAGEAHALGGG